ncbi:MAG: GHMP kinase [bacterium]|nr:GHMP kinase [bacterium]
MEILRSRSYARAGLLGNPSDGYHGKTISFIVRDYYAEVILYEWEHLEVVFTAHDHGRFNSIYELANDVKTHGYYGGIRLVKASIKRFVDFCDGRFELHDRTFSIRYESNIPRQVGLAGSSAIIVATLRALIQFYDVPVEPDVLASLVLSVEWDELGIAAGLQDRVIQAYEGLVFMDFSESKMVHKQGLWCGSYEPLDPQLLPPVYVAFNANEGEPTEKFHNNLRARYDQKEPAVVDAIRKFADLAEQGKAALLAGDHDSLAACIDANFDTRLSICRLPHSHVEMVRVARRAGATAKFAGSGGAIVGTLPDEDAFERVAADLAEIGCTVFRPQIAPADSPSE